MSPLLLCLTTFAGTLVGSVVPVVNVEILLLGVAAVAPAWLVLPLALVAAAATMVGKTGLYLCGHGALRLGAGRAGIRGRAGGGSTHRFAGRFGERFAERFAARGAEAMHRLERLPRLDGALLFASASVGLPPFYATSLASGALGIDLRRFLVVGFLGRFLRFAALLLAPQLLRGLLP